MSFNEISKKFAKVQPTRITDPKQRRRLPDKTQLEAKRKLSKVTPTEKPKIRNYRDEAGVKAAKALASVAPIQDEVLLSPVDEERTAREENLKRATRKEVPKSQLELSKTKFENDPVEPDPVLEGYRSNVKALKSVAPTAITMANHTLSSPITKDPSRMPIPQITTPLAVERRFDPSRKKMVPVVSSQEPRIILSHYYASQDHKMSLKSM